MIAYKVFGYIGLGMIIGYVVLRVAGQFALRKLVRAEFEQVLNSDECKVKGKYNE